MTLRTATRIMEPFGGPVDAIVQVPGSKSFTNRALVCAALAEGTSTLEGVLESDDTEAMFGCLDMLGVVVDHDPIRHRATVTGSAGASRRSDVVLDVRQSGTTARFVTPMAALGSGRFVIDGHPQMRARPMGDLVGALTELGVRLAGADRLPLTVEAAGVRGGRVSISGTASSQFLSGLLLSAPYFAEGLTVEVQGELVSKPYVDMTIATMQAFGASIDRRDHSWFRVEPTGYRACDYRIEPDASAASYFFAAAAITGGRVRVEGLGRDTLQGDIEFVDILKSMGCAVQRSTDAMTVEGPEQLRGTDVDMRNCSDTAQTLAAVAVFADGPTRVRGIGFIRRKETDRIAAVIRELDRCGIDAAEEADGFLVQPGMPSPAEVETYDDHRMAMSFALLGLRAPGIVICDPGCVAKTFPDYFDVLETQRPSALAGVGGVGGVGG